MDIDLARMRKEYEDAGLDEADFGPEPMPHFGEWLTTAHEAQLVEPNAMVLSTVGPDGAPTGRWVLCKGISSGDEGRLGIEFYTNYNSQKGQHLAQNRTASVTFGWLALNRQIRMQGPIEKMTAEESDVYFAKRPPLSQIGAMVSDQSEVLADRSVLEKAFADAADVTPVRPDHWGGYRLVPQVVEFWQGRRSRLHDRIRYTFTEATETGAIWSIDRLAP